jgi:hypothetical protein
MAAMQTVASCMPGPVLRRPGFLGCSLLCNTSMDRVQMNAAAAGLLLLGSVPC